MNTLPQTILQLNIPVSSLLPILRNEIVVLRVSKQAFSKRTNTDSILVITPMEIKPQEKKYLFSIPNHGCQLLSKAQIKPINFYKLGLTFRASKLFANEFNRILTLEDQYHGY